DIASGYHHVLLSLESRSLTAFITPNHGILQYCRTPMGLSDAGAAFQTAVDHILAGLPGVYAYSDDILIAGKTQQEHDSRLHAVLECLSQNNCHLKPSKLVISTDTVPMLSRIISAKENQPTSIRPDPKNVAAIIQMTSPTTKQQVQCFIGAAGFLKDFLPQITEWMTPLRKSLIPPKFVWMEECEKCFQKIKETLSDPELLICFDPN
ncbi:MAG: RNA-directed DNA polymerase, partial [Desulfobulbaceae bacterium]|nr:RNA-directed DNA polymerase [Desulfobulbaceae bacterium]